MPSLLPLFFDVLNKRLVMSQTNPDPFLVPALYQEDSYVIDFTALLPTGNPFVPIYNRLNLAGYQLQISVGSAAVINASATVWIPNADNTVLTGTLAMNTAGINGLADGASQLFEIRLFDGTNYNRGQQNVTIRKSVAVTGALIQPAQGTALSTDEAARVYARKEGRAAEAIILTSASGLKRCILYCHDDGSFRGEPLN